MPGRLAALAAGRRARWVVIGAWAVLALALASLQPKLQDKAADESKAFQGASAESTRLDDLVDARFGEGAEVTSLLVYRRASGLTDRDAQRISAEAVSLCRSHALPDLKRVITPQAAACGDIDGGGYALGPSTPFSGPLSRDGTTALITVHTTDDSTPAVVRTAGVLRELIPRPDDKGLQGYVTGEAAFAADQSNAMEGIDGTLLTITALLILVLLLAIYRSPVIALVPLLAVSLAYLVAAGAVYGLSELGAFKVTGQATAILIVLMFGAGTDYCLLLVSRFREELRATEDAQQAIVRAATRSAPAILSAGATVFAAMLVLWLADYRATRWMGPVLATGVAVTVLAGLTLLPALLSVLGRRAFWPRVPRGQAAPPAIWRRAGRIVAGRPVLTGAAVLALLALGAAGNLHHRGALTFSEGFRHAPESVQGERLVRAKFPPGQTAPLQMVVANDAASAVNEALSRDPDVAYVQSSAFSRDRTLTLMSAVLKVDPLSERATEAIPRLRAEMRGAAAGRMALMGGATAENHDRLATLRADAKLIVPLTLLAILAIVALLVRALVAPLYLVVTVVLSYAFALGASGLLFSALGTPHSDPALPLFAFIFLVALGVDYNIFLIGRIREEHRRRPTAEAVVAGLERSGGVITSAGLLLAGTFCALMALELVGLVQVGFTVAFGLLVDTFAIRVFLVPAIALRLGERNWWPAGRRRRRVPDEPWLTHPQRGRA